MSRRTERLARAIREVVSSTILFDLRDPRVKNVTVLNVEVAGDMRTAKVFVSVRGDDRESSLALHGLNAARGYIQSKLGDRVELRYTPVLTFQVDDSIKKSFEAARILKELEDREGPLNPPAEQEALDDDDDDADPESDEFDDAAASTDDA